MANCYIDPNDTLGWDALYPYVLPYVMGAPDELVLGQLRLAAIDFCKRSSILHDENTFDMQAAVTDYFLTTLCDYQIIRTYKVTVLDRWEYYPSINKPRQFTCGPYQFWMENVDVLKLSRPFTNLDSAAVPPQTTNQNLRVEFIIAPKQDGCVLDNYLYENWGEGIAYGAIARLLKMPKAPWFNPAMGNDYELKFRKETARARTAADMNFTSGSVEMQMRRWV